MVSTARRITAAFLAVFFAVAGVVYPVSASAATYNAASNLSGLFRMNNQYKTLHKPAMPAPSESTQVEADPGHP